jgi:hypothetical protein
MFYTLIGTGIKFQTKRIHKLTSIVEKSSATNYATSIPTLCGMQHSVRIFCHLMVKHYISYAKRREINSQNVDIPKNSANVYLTPTRGFEDPDNKTSNSEAYLGYVDI